MVHAGHGYAQRWVTPMGVLGSYIIHESAVAIANTAQCTNSIDICLPVGFTFLGIDLILSCAKIRCCYDNFKSNFGLVFEHENAKEIEASLGGRMVVLAVDNQEGIIGNASSMNAENLHVMWTKNAGIVFLMKEFIVHDMYLIDVGKNLSAQMKIVYGKNLKALKDKIFGANSGFSIH